MQNNFWNDLPKPFYILAPMEAVTDVVFRHVVASAARPDVFFTEFTNAASYFSPKGIQSTRGRLAFTPDEHPMVAQIWGNTPEHFAFMAKGLAEMGYKGIDINMGCPDKAVVRQGSGSGLICNDELSAQLIAAAKEGGLPVSVKTRLGRSDINEWRPWLTHILKQDVVNLTIHLRTRKEMSKVPAHFELIPEIKRLRDEIAPQTLLTINGDIRDRAHGEELAAKYGVDGIMIGRGIFTNPFAFEQPVAKSQSSPPSESSSASLSRLGRQPQAHEADEEFGRAGDRVTLEQARATDDAFGRVGDEETAKSATQTTGLANLSRSCSVNAGDTDLTMPTHTREELLGLLKLQLDLHDKYDKELEPRRFEPLKRYFKIYVRDFAGASELRDKLMHTHTTEEVRELISQHEIQ